VELIDISLLELLQHQKTLSDNLREIVSEVMIFDDVIQISDVILIDDVIIII
jgi:hypothetical protein